MLPFLDHVISSPELSPAECCRVLVEPELPIPHPPHHRQTASALFLRFLPNQSPVFAQFILSDCSRNQESPPVDGGLGPPRILSSTSSPIQHRDSHSHAANTTVGSLNRAPQNVQMPNLIFSGAELKSLSYDTDAKRRE